MLAAILSALAGFFGFFKEITSWFKKTPQQKVDQAEKELHQEMDDVKNGGRPKWD